MSSIGSISGAFNLAGGTNHQGLMPSRPQGTASVFAADIMRRAQAPEKTASTSSGTGTTGTPTAPAVDEKTEALKQKLEKALADTVSYMAEKHGTAAGTAMMGIVYKRLNTGEVNENTLGNALLDVARFVDAQFGIQEGDKFLNQLNGDLNKNLNAYFDNGKNEEFYASTFLPSKDEGLSVDLSGLRASEAATNNDPAAIIQDAISNMLDSIKNMREQNKQAQALSSAMPKDMLAYTKQTQPAPLASGALTDSFV